MLRAVEHIAQRQHDARVWPMLVKEAQRGQQLAVDTPRHVVGDHQRWIEGPCHRVYQSLAHPQHPLKAHP
jgi:hypothetical protein